MAILAVDSEGIKSSDRPRPLLVLTTSYSAPPEINDLHTVLPPISANFDPKTGEIKDPGYSYSEALIGKYILQSVSRDMFITRPGKPDRICSCLRMNVPGTTETLVKRSEEFKRCHYGNLVVCGSVWKCPVCNSKISEKRGSEVRPVIESHIAAGGKVAFLTFTIPHARQDILSLMLKQLQSAFNRTWISKSAKRLKKEIQMSGYIRSKEVTYGYANGWHPHLHQLVLYWSENREDEILELIKDELYPVWKNRCEKVGLGSPSYEHGLDVRGGHSAAEYLVKFGKEQKWGLDKELTKGNSKKSNDDNRYTPFDFLREYIQTESKDMTRLFLEYADAFHGSQFVTWSKGLKQKYGIDDSVQKDEEIANSVDELAKLIGRINLNDWKKILFHKKQADVLIFAEKSWEITQEYINSLSRPYYRRRKNGYTR